MERAGHPGDVPPVHLVMQRYIMQRTQISLTTDERRMLDGVSARTGQSLSAVIQHAVNKVYGDQGSVDADVAALRFAFGAWGAEGAEMPDAEQQVDSMRAARRIRTWACWWTPPS